MFHYLIGNDRHYIEEEDVERFYQKAQIMTELLLTGT